MKKSRRAPGLIVALYRRLVAADHRFAAWIVGRSRRLLVRVYDPDIDVAFGRGSLTLPLSHDLPFTRADHPGYSDNLRRVVSEIAIDRPQPVVVDIGANVGDSVVLIDRPDVRFLCIEGHPDYFEYLCHNTRSMENVRAVREMVGVEGARLELAVERGTASPTASADGVAARSLADIVAEAAPDESVALLKIDTDGYDADILRASAGWIRSERPTLFFEYDPSMQAADAPPIRSVVRELAAEGYRWLVVWDKNGELLVAVEGDDVLDDLDRYVRAGQRRYFDVLMTDDPDLFSRLRRREHEVMDLAVSR